jgi:pentatricopeptide repeat protein
MPRCRAVVRSGVVSQAGTGLGSHVAGQLVDSLRDMSLSEADRAALSGMLEAQPDLDRWRLRAQRVEEPESGSDLALDDKVFPHMAISQLARMSLVLSGEHLRLALDALRAKQLYPSSHFTVLRGALVGAAQGVWILSPADRAERRERGLTVLAEMYSQMGKYYDSLAGLSQDDLEKLDDQKDWLSDRKAGVAAVRTGRADLNLTVVIREAAEDAFARAGHHEAARRLWREMSADAHVLGWSVFQRSSFGPPDRRTGIGEGRAPGSPGHIAEAFLASYRILKHGWSLFDRRCEQATGA